MFYGSALTLADKRTAQVTIGPNGVTNTHTVWFISAFSRNFQKNPGISLVIRLSAQNPETPVNLFK